MYNKELVAGLATIIICVCYYVMKTEHNILSTIATNILSSSGNFMFLILIGKKRKNE
jgi:hypothetical protein